jgi:AhpC/TSA family
VSLRWLSSLACVLACTAEPAPTEAGKNTTPTREHSALDLAGQIVDPFTHNDRADLLLFVRTDCPISNRYAPELARIIGRFATQPLDVWLVYVDDDETPERIQKHMTEYRLPGTALRDPGQSLASRAGVKVTPEAALFDADGQRRYRGRIDDRHVDYGKQRAEPSTHELLDAITAVMAGQTPTLAEVDAVGCPLPPPG